MAKGLPVVRPSYAVRAGIGKSPGAGKTAGLRGRGSVGWRPVSRALDVVAPPRMGRSFRWLLASSWVSNIGDGIALAAGPLLVASQTSDAFLVALAALLQRLPWLLFGLFAGVVADRLDRRLVVVLVDSLRASVLVVLATMIITGHVSVAV